MPKVLSLEGYDFVIYLGDHEPPHVHVRRGGGEAIVTIGNGRGEAVLRQEHGLKRHELRRAIELVEDHRPQLLGAWRQHNG